MKQSKLHTQSDEALMVQIMDHHNHEALVELHQRYSKRLLGYFIKMLNRDVDLAQDFVQELFLKLLEKKHLYNPDKLFYSWVFAIASNMSKTAYRHHGKMITFQPELHQGSGLDESMLEKKEFTTALQLALDALEHIHKEVFVLRFQEHFSLQEISDITEVSLGTVKSRLFNATRKIADQLKAFDPTYESNLFKLN